MLGLIPRSQHLAHKHSITIATFINTITKEHLMFGLFRSKGVTKLRSVFSDYDLINQIYHKLKDLNDSEIKTRKAIRDNNHSVILSEVNKQGRILGNIDYLLKIKSLRVGELNKARAGIFKQ